MPENTSLITPLYKHMAAHRWAFDAASWTIADRIKRLKVKGVRHLEDRTFILLNTPDPDRVYQSVVHGLNGGRS
jgi:hypothetical protein